MITEPQKEESTLKPPRNLLIIYRINMQSHRTTRKSSTNTNNRPSIKRKLEKEVEIQKIGNLMTNLSISREIHMKDRTISMGNKHMEKVIKQDYKNLRLIHMALHMDNRVKNLESLLCLLLVKIGRGREDHHHHLKKGLWRRALLEYHWIGREP